MWCKKSKGHGGKFEGIPTGHVWDNLIVMNFNPLSKLDIQSKTNKEKPLLNSRMPTSNSRRIDKSLENHHLAIITATITTDSGKTHQ